MVQSVADRAARLLQEEENWGRRALRRASLTWWNASLSGKSSDYERMAAADRTINRHYGRPSAYKHVSRMAAEPGHDPLTRRRLERLERAYRSKQASLDLLDRLTAAEAAIQERYSTFRGQFEGRAVSDNELEDVLRGTRDSDRAEAAWQARKQIGGAVADDLRSLAEMRNETARAIGFQDFWHQQLLLDELDPRRLVQTLESVDTATESAFRSMKDDLDERLAEHFGIDQGDLRPWHYGDPFFQETQEVFAPQSDPLYAEQDVVELSAETYRRLGFGVIDSILARSDLYPREGKNQHAYAVDIDREGDVRTFLNVQPNARWMGTLLHELGHTIYQDGIDRTELPYDLRDDPQGFLNEGFAMFCEQAISDPLWLSEMAGLPSEEAGQLAPQLRAQETASLLAFVRWCLTIVNFERAFYADPAQNLNGLWWDLAERYQLVSRPTGRNEPDWASKVHVATAPVYYHKYLYGRLFAAQLTHEVNRRFGGWWKGGAKSGAYVRDELFAPGARYPWPELVQRVTGQPLGVEALGTALAWPARR